MGQGVDPLLQAAVLRVQQRRLLALEGAVGVGVLTKLVDHGELQEDKDAFGLFVCLLVIFALVPHFHGSNCDH